MNTQKNIEEILASLQNEISTLKQRSAQASVEIERLTLEVSELKKRSAQTSVEVQTLTEGCCKK